MEAKYVIALTKTPPSEMFKWVRKPQNTGYLSWLASILLIACFASPSITFAQGDSPILVETQKAKFLTGKKLDRRNLQALSLWWRDAGLRDRLVAFSETQDIAIMLDRRVDPSTIVNLGIENRTVEKKVARRSSVKWTIKRPVRTGPIVATKSLIEAIATKHGFTINGLEELPHDLWYSVSLPPTSVLGQIQLMLAGFGKTFEIDPSGKSITIIDFPKLESARRVFRVAKRPANMKKLTAQFPELRVSYRSKTITATGPPKQLALLESALIEQVKSQADQKENFTLNTEAERLTILRTIAQTSKLELVLGEIPLAELSDRIKINVTKITQDELIFETLKGSRFNAKVVEGKLVVSENR